MNGVKLMRVLNIIRAKIRQIRSVLDWTDKYYYIDIDAGNTLQTRVSTGVKGIDYDISLEGEAYDDLKVILLVYKGSSIEYIPQDPDDSDGAKLRAFRAAGVEHLYTYICNKRLQGISEEPDQVLEIGTYQKDSESRTFKGTCTAGRFSQGQAYGVVPAIRIGSYYYILSTGSTARYYNPFIYWWPNRSNGAPYE